MTAEPNNIANFDDERLIREGEVAVDLYNKDLKNVRARIMPMARGLLAARRKYPADQEFGDWLQTSSYREIDKDERAALIKIGERDTFAEKFVRTTSLVSPRTIWDAIRDLLPVSHDAKPTPEVPPLPQIPPLSAPTAKTDEPPENKPAPTGPSRALTERSGFHGAPRAAEIAAVFQSEKSRAVLSQIWRERGGKQVWELIVRALDAGLLVANDRAFREPTLLVLFPLAPVGYSSQFNLSNQKQRSHIRDVVLPAMIACRDKLLADPDRTREILSEYQNKQRVQQRDATHKEQRTAAISALPAGQQELVMFGQILWPRLDTRLGEYDYDQIRAAVWTFRDLDSWNKQITADGGVNSRAIRIRLSTKWYGEYLLRNGRDNPVRKILSLVQHISRLLEQHPDAECRWPPYPTAEAEW